MTRAQRARRNARVIAAFKKKVPCKQIAREQRVDIEVVYKIVKPIRRA